MKLALLLFTLFFGICHTLNCADCPDLAECNTGKPAIVDCTGGTCVHQQLKDRNTGANIGPFRLYCLKRGTFINHVVHFLTNAQTTFDKTSIS